MVGKELINGIPREFLKGKHNQRDTEMAVTCATLMCRMAFSVSSAAILSSFACRGESQIYTRLCVNLYPL